MSWPVLAEDDHGHRMIITKGAPEGLLKRCTAIPDAARTALQAEFAAGNRVIAAATREMPGASSISTADEHDLIFRGILVFLDPPKPTAKAALARLADLGVTVKILTGDNPVVAAKVCADLGLPPGQVATGADIDKAGDQLGDLLARTTVFARVSPEHKAQIVQTQRATGADVAFLGDGVNDAVALHAADVGVSVDSATDVAKDAADVPRHRTAGYRVHRRAARFTIGHSLQPADGPNPDKAGRKRRTPTGATGLAPDHAPGV